ncbi:M57 family metalloprotease [Niabella sp.]|uniref:M57 family metalloprotease n=1 Tax=Niabella sp. TaxID=1962976 RepID=UPI00261459A2|nr:M57 family metalloprotease [Niabella sp.]
MRKKNVFLQLAILLCFFVGCQKNDKMRHSKEIPQDVLERIVAEGFSAYGVVPYKDGYIVEGDIYITETQLRRTMVRSVLPNLDGSLSNKLLPGNIISQYRTTNIVKGTSPAAPRTIRVLLDPNANQVYSDAFDNALARYNNALISLKFVRVTSSADISVVFGALPGSTIGLSPGFPSSEGNPGTQIVLDNVKIGSSPFSGFLTTTIAHEIGHAIGFRHTDYFNRDYSCPYEAAYNNEGAGSDGAIHIPGTPTAEDANSWMLACIADSDDRPFTANDLSALATLYPFLEIQGSLAFCNSANYTIRNLPAGATVNWSLANSSLGTITTSGGTATVTKAANGKTNLLANVSVNGNTYTCSNSIILGYDPPTVSVSPLLHNGGGTATIGGSYIFTANSTSALTYRWELTNGIGGASASQYFMTSPDQSTVEVNFNTTGKYFLKLYITNECVSNVLVYTKGILVVDDGGPIQ